jgi:WhiB family redox-sensing transcriptional regulator
MAVAGRRRRISEVEALTLWLMRPGAPEVALTPSDVLNRPAWHDHARCRNQDANEWVKDSRMAAYTAQKSVCRTCPVRGECLSFALAHPELTGCWGGTTDRERRSLRKEDRTRTSA